MGQFTLGLSPRHVTIDPGMTVPAAYERFAGGYLALARRYDWETAPNVLLTTPVGGWTLANTGAGLTSLAAAAGVLTATHNAVNTRWSAGTYNAPFLYQVIRPPTGYFRAVARFQSNADANYEGCGILVTRDAAGSNTFVVCNIKFNGFGDASTQDAVLYGESAGAALTGRGDADSVFSVAQLTAGVWLMLERGPGSTWKGYYSVANQATPPTSWTQIPDLGAGFGGMAATSMDADSWRVGVYGDSENVSGTHVWTCMYFDASSAENPERGTGNGNPSGTAGGFDDTNAAIQLLTDLDIGAGAVLTDANLQAALAAGENQRYAETANWTWSAVRSATVGAAAGAYAASGAATVSGTGRYFSLFAKCSSDAEKRGSFHLPSFNLPYAGA